MIASRVALCAVVLAVSACASAQGTQDDLPPIAAKVAPIVQSMTPIRRTEPAVAQVAVGQASWYGSRFQGRPTASGEPFDMNALTAAHRTLPFGTRIRVINEANGKSVIVRVNDRGPFAGKRIIDLSRKAAESIGLRAKGVGPVTLLVLKEA